MSDDGTPRSKPGNIFTVKLRPLPGVANPIRALRWALKRLLRDYKLRCIPVSEERDEI
jgi:hypothetical protein